MCVPLRDAEPHLPMFFSHLRNFTYPHHLIDLAFLVSDSKDRTLPLLIDYLEKLQADPDPLQNFGEISVIEKDFGQKVQQDVENRHGFAAQASRRKTMAQARNWLLSATLRPYHSWVYWRDADVETAPPTILEDLMRHNKDVIVPSKLHPRIFPTFSASIESYDVTQLYLLLQRAIYPMRQSITFSDHDVYYLLFKYAAHFTRLDAILANGAM